MPALPTFARHFGLALLFVGAALAGTASGVLFAYSDDLPAISALDAYQQRTPTRQVNDVIRLAQQSQPAPGGARVLYATQAAVDPPTFTLFANRALPDSYLRYLERKYLAES